MIIGSYDITNFKRVFLPLVTSRRSAVTVLLEVIEPDERDNR